MRGGAGVGVGYRGGGGGGRGSWGGGGVQTNFAAIIQDAVGDSFTATMAGVAEFMKSSV